ncbi:diguanylate cyclase [Agaribacter flavus]|uniref:diguanylate cyclase n=1 Tax=Agaribacter flavus TaxID=1902781 RepID=A0ABV7FRV0_9ALTE
MTDLKPKILIVDDERLNIRLLYEGLKDEYQIIVGSTGRDAIRLATKELPDLVLLDIGLDDISGHEVCKALKANPTTKNIPIIFVTAQDTYEDELKGLELGAIDYFRKPFSIPLVRVRVRNQIELKRKTDMLQYLSSIDGLTGLANRRQFDEHLSSTVRYADRQHRGLCLLMIDIDRFKQYNDLYGHVRGDDALKVVARVLKKCAARPLDFIARFGGEEFIILLTDSSPEEGALVAERIREQVEKLFIPHEGSEYGFLSVSVGVANIKPDVGEHIDERAFVEHADTCLYFAKESGRNRVISEDFELQIKPNSKK